MKLRELSPIKEKPSDFDELEEIILRLFRAELFLPLLRELGIKPQLLRNAKDGLLEEIQSGRIRYSRGRFTGRFDSHSSKALKKLGGEWDRKNGAWRIPLSRLPLDIRQAISVSESRLVDTFKRVDSALQKVVPEKIASKLKTEKFFSKLLWKVNKNVEKSISAITVPARLTPEQRAKIASDYTNNLSTYISDFTRKQTVSLRKKIQKSTFEGYRYESMVDEIQKAYGVTARKAKFLARQETSLLMTAFKKSRYTAAGINEYRWDCVKMPHDTSPNQHTPGYVRYYHGLNEGKIFRWDAPPVINSKGQRKNPGEDYNCRCTAIPIFRTK